MRDISTAMGIGFDMTPRMLRRRFKDLARMGGTRASCQERIESARVGAA